ncbi:hypothetical protein HK098_006809 [Nowakowskiella sp. JEL0407]|nr:hypothetical protein HK098_006809 [Nowakowskiella sp. JEL0407]
MIMKRFILLYTLISSLCSALTVKLSVAYLEKPNNTRSLGYELPEPPSIKYDDDVLLYPQSIPSQRMIQGMVLNWDNPCSSRDYISEVPAVAQIANATNANAFILLVDLGSGQCSSSTKMLYLESAITALSKSLFQSQAKIVLIMQNIRTIRTADAIRFWQNTNFINFDLTLNIENKQNDFYQAGKGTFGFQVPMNSSATRFLFIELVVNPPSSNSFTDFYGASQWFSTIVFVLIVACYCCYRRMRRNRLQSNGPVQISLQTIPNSAPNAKTLPVLTTSQLDLIAIKKYSEVPKRSGTFKDADSDDKEKLRITSSNACSVCLDGFNDVDDVRLLPECSHLFHKDCIDEWLLHRSCYCPNCRLDTRVALGIPVAEQTSTEEGSGSNASNAPSNSVVLQISDGETVPLHVPDGQRPTQRIVEPVHVQSPLLSQNNMSEASHTDPAPASRNVASSSNDSRL